MVAFRRGALLAAAVVSTCDAIHRTPPVQDDRLRRLGGGHHVANVSGTKTMAVDGHTVSEVSERWTGKVVYAIFTSAIPRYHAALVSQLESWAERPAEEGRYVAVGGSNYPDEWQGKNVLRSQCGDGMDGISCKEATLLAEGAARGADWVYIIGEDNYVQTRNVEKWLEDKDPDKAVAYGVHGCGRGLFCKDNQAFNEGGGFCGGGGYILSRATLQRLLAHGAPALHEIYDNSTWPNDMTTSCQLRKRDVRLTLGPVMHGMPVFKISDYERIAKSDFVTTHYVSPPVMRWLHAEVEDKPDSVKKPLEELAFDHGCGVGTNKTHWNVDWMTCQGTQGGRQPKDRERAIKANLKPEEPLPYF